MPQLVILPHVIEQRLKEDERQEVIDFINELIADTSSQLKVDIIEILEERFEKKLSEGLINLKLELVERISSSDVKNNERTISLEAKLSERIAITEAKLSEKIDERIAKTETKLDEKIDKLDARITRLEVQLNEKIDNSKVETIRWMFIFWIGNVVTIIGGIIGILKIAKVF
jgi:hypothetical protein